MVIQGIPEINSFLSVPINSIIDGKERVVYSALNKIMSGLIYGFNQKYGSTINYILERLEKLKMGK